LFFFLFSFLPESLFCHIGPLFFFFFFWLAGRVVGRGSETGLGRGEI